MCAFIQHDTGNEAGLKYLFDSAPDSTDFASAIAVVSVEAPRLCAICTFVAMVVVDEPEAPFSNGGI